MPIHPPPRRLRTLSLVLALALPSPILVAEEPRLLNIKDVAPGVIVDMRYATPDNFTKQVLYPAAECLLCEPAARRLAKVQEKLERRGLGLKVWDCYRPLSVQKKLWAITPDPRYVADPKTGSRHNRGASVDLTLVDSTGRELLMPTAYDDFSERAHRSFAGVPAEAAKNRKILEEAMEEEGFVGLATEWWHFDDPSWKQFALRDEPLGSPALAKDAAADRPKALIMPEVKQLIVVTSKAWDAPVGRLQRWERDGDGWKRVGADWTVSLGKKGMSWGRGTHSIAEGPAKKEGDLTAPAGIFPVGRAYGYAAAPPAGVRWPYQALAENWVCVDDPASRRYNEVFDAAGAEKDWSSAETMRREDHLYKWLINVEQNTPTECGCGSCIFLHIWRRPESPTEGCTAMDESDIIALMRWLDPAAHPALVQLPEDVYARLRDEWDLP